MEEDRRWGGGRVGGEVAATVHLTVRTLVQMPHGVLRTAQQGPSVAFFCAHAARCTVHRAPHVHRAAEWGARLWRRAHSAPFTQHHHPSLLGGIGRLGGDGGRDAVVWVEDAVRTLVEMPRVAPRAAQLGPST